MRYKISYKRVPGEHGILRFVEFDSLSKVRKAIRMLEEMDKAKAYSYDIVKL